MMSEHVMEAQNIKMYFGGVHAVDDISVYVDKNEILGIIGPNGSGKTTLVNVLTGIYTPTEGKCLFNGQDITGKKLQNMTGLGIARTFQNLRIFKALTVMDNILVGQHLTISLVGLRDTSRVYGPPLALPDFSRDHSTFVWVFTTVL